MVEILGVVNVVTPVPPDNTVPPDDAAYQSTVQPAGTLVTPILTVPVPHLLPLDAVANPGALFTVAVTAVLVVDVHPVVVFLV